MTELDTTRAPRGVLAAQALVAAVAEHGDLAERHYLELKSALDLSTKKDKEKIAKFILGAGNRMPKVAASAFEGYAVMVIGVAKGAITGIPPVEMMEISKVIQQYVGAGGPRWDVVWVPVPGSENQVLIVLVDPPQFGQGPFPCRANGESLSDGRIYIRAEGETREAKAEEVDLLVQRGSVNVADEVDFGIEFIGDIATVTIDAGATVDDFIASTRKRLVDAMPHDDADSQTGTAMHKLTDTAGYGVKLSSMSAMLGASTEPERRSKEEYLKSIDDWETRFRAAWPAATALIASSRLAPAIIKVTNRTTTFFHDVELKVHMEGDVFAFDYTEPEMVERMSDLDLPKPPREWGPMQRAFGMPNYANLAPFYSGSPIPQYTPPPSITFRNGGSVALDVEVGELRPRGTYESEDDAVVLVVADRSLEMIHVTWELTARDHNHVYTGETNVAVTGDRNFTREVRTILGLADEDVEPIARP